MQEVDLGRARELRRLAKPAALRVKAVLQLPCAALDCLGGLAGFKRVPLGCIQTQELHWILAQRSFSAQHRSAPPGGLHLSISTFL